MAQLNITLNQEEILLLLSNNRDEAFKTLLKECLNKLLQVESAEQLHAESYERNTGRTDFRNGTRERTLNTRMGSILLAVPRHRNTPFKTDVFENYERSEKALLAGMMEMVVLGVSTRKVSRIVEELCGTSFSKSTVSDLCRDLDENVHAFQQRPLTKRYPFVILDATYFKVRENHRVISKALMIAYGTNEHGEREIIDFRAYERESKETWNAFLRNLKERGLHGVFMIVSDAHEGIRDASSKVYPDAPWQRCQFHFAKNIIDKVPKKYQAGLRYELQTMFRCHTVEAARKLCDEIIRDYGDIAENAMKILDEGFESAMTVMALPEHLRRFYRTSNHIERLNRELKRRSRVIGVFPNEESLVRIIGSFLLEIQDQLQQKKRIFKENIYDKLLGTGIPEKLIQIAHEQLKLLAA